MFRAHTAHDCSSSGGVSPHSGEQCGLALVTGVAGFIGSHLAGRLLRPRTVVQLLHRCRVVACGARSSQLLPNSERFATA